MNKHTPGPWKVESELGSRNWVIAFDAGSRGRGIAIAETRSGVTGASELSNARLIAEAPEMLSVLQAVYDVLRNDNPGIIGTIWAPGENSSVTLEQLVGDVLAKVGGEE